MRAVWAVAIGLILWLLWLIGLIGIVLLTLWGGCVAVEFFIRFISTAINLPEKPNQDLQRIPPWLTGVIERLVFLMLVVAQVEDIASAMMAWLGIKLASNWHLYDPEKELTAPTRALLAALAGLLSLTFAYFGGVLLRRWLGIQHTAQPIRGRASRSRGLGGQTRGYVDRSAQRSVILGPLERSVSENVVWSVPHGL